MSFSLPGRWVWDFWTSHDGASYHLFFLQADRALGDPDLRHWHASIGHAVSADLTNWQYLGACLYPSAAPAWDDGTTWTGSVLRHGDRWHLFYTGVNYTHNFRRRDGEPRSTVMHASCASPWKQG